MKKAHKIWAAFYCLRFSVLAVFLLFGGCGIISMLGKPTSHEMKIPAEYELAEDTGRKILILVEQPGYLNAQTKVRYYLTESLQDSLVEKVEIGRDDFVGYDKLAEFRSSKAEFSLLSPAEVGRALGADMVLFVVIESYELSEIVESGYYSGALSARAILFDTAGGGKVWPKDGRSKGVRVGFEIEEAGCQASVGRLAAACAYCTTRYFYDCPKNKFKIAEDRSDISWETWGN